MGRDQMLDSEPKENQENRRSCTFYGCMGVLTLIVILAGLIASRFISWKQCRIPLPDGSGSVTYMAQRNMSICGEWKRKIRVDTNTMHSPAKWIPGDTAGGSPVNVYWYPAHGAKGPYLRFQDPLSEYLVDIRHGKALLIVRPGCGAYAGEVLHRLSGWDAFGPTSTLVDGKWVVDNDSVQVEVDGRRAHKLENWVASRPGQYIGCISHSYWRFISSKESPEQPVAQH